MDDALTALTDAEWQLIPHLKWEIENPVHLYARGRVTPIYEAHIWDSRLHEICNDIGLDYQKTAGRFVSLGLLRQDIGRSEFIVTGKALGLAAQKKGIKGH